MQYDRGENKKLRGMLETLRDELKAARKQVETEHELFLAAHRARAEKAEQERDSALAREAGLMDAAQNILHDLTGTSYERRGCDLLNELRDAIDGCEAKARGEGA